MQILTFLHTWEEKKNRAVAATTSFSFLMAKNVFSNIPENKHSAQNGPQTFSSITDKLKINIFLGG